MSLPQNRVNLITLAVAVAAAFATDWGGCSCYVADPDGHRWEFARNPFSWLDGEGWIARA